MIRKSIAIFTLLIVCVAGCRSTNGYSPATCDRLIKTINEARNIDDIPASTWQTVVLQCCDTNEMLDKKVETLIATPWSTQKENDIKELLNSQLYHHWVALTKITQPLTLADFAPSQHIDSHVLDQLAEKVQLTRQHIAQLRAQADIDTPMH